MGRGLLPAHRVKDSRGTGEIDWQHKNAKVLLPGLNGGYVTSFVRITSGDHLNGQGVVEDKKGSTIKFGTPIAYGGGTESGIRPKFLRKLHRKSKAPDMLEQAAKQLAVSMQAKW